MPRAFSSDELTVDVGESGRSIPLDALIVPSDVALSGETLEFRWQSGTNVVAAPPALLGRFISAKAEDDILQFARTFGGLELRQRDGVWLPEPQTIVQRAISGLSREKLRSWREFRTEAEAILEIVDSWRDHRPAASRSLEDLAVVGLIDRYSWLTTNIYARDSTKASKAWPDLPERRRQEVALDAARIRLQELAHACGLRPALLFSEKGTANRVSRKVDLVFQDNAADKFGGGLSLCGALTIQLLAAAAGGRLFVCSGCGRTFSPKRSPAKDRRQFCDRCRREGKPLLMAKHDYRRRQKLKVKQVGKSKRTKR